MDRRAPQFPSQRDGRYPVERRLVPLHRDHGVLSRADTIGRVADRLHRPSPRTRVGVRRRRFTPGSDHPQQLEPAVAEVEEWFEAILRGDRRRACGRESHRSDHVVKDVELAWRNVRSRPTTNPDDLLNVAMYRASDLAFRSPISRRRGTPRRRHGHQRYGAVCDAAQSLRNIATISCSLSEVTSNRG
jgi:hypothetical protein